MTDSRVTGAIIAGGAALPLGGAAKGLLEVGGRRILDRLVDAFQEALGEPPLLVANAPEARGWRDGLQVVADRRPGAGTLGGLWTAVVEAKAPGGGRGRGKAVLSPPARPPARPRTPARQR